MPRLSFLATLALIFVVGAAHGATTCGVAPIAPGIAPPLDAACLNRHLIPIGIAVPVGIGLETGCGHTTVLHSDIGPYGSGGYLYLGACAEAPCERFNGGGGSSAIECQLANGYGCGQVIGVFMKRATGVRRGALRDGIRARFAADTDPRIGICYQDYRGNGSRIVYLPIVEAFANPAAPLRVVGFVGFFLTSLPGDEGTLQGEYLYVVAPGCCGAVTR